MSDSFDVDTASLGRFRGAVERAQDRVGTLQGLADGARLAPGTFTRTEGGQRADAAHAEMLNGIVRTLKTTAERLRAIAEATGKTINNYESTDSRHASEMSDIRRRLDFTRG